MRKAAFVGSLVACVAVLGGCGGGDGGGGPVEPRETVRDVDVEADSTVTVLDGTPTICAGATARFEATARDRSGQAVTTTFSWLSLDPSVATVDGSGTATGVGPGEAGIVAEARNGVRDTAFLAVLDTARANLRAVALELFPSGVLADETAGAWAVVRTGCKEAGPYRVAVREGARLLGSAQAEALDARATDTVELSGLGPFVEGIHHLTLDVDSEDALDETDESDNAATARLESYPPGYDIGFQFLSGVSEVLRNTVELTGGRWSEVITGDVPDVEAGPDGIALDSCFADPQGLPDRTEPIDDMLILVREDSIDGVGGTLARAGPCYVRSDEADPELPPIPVVGVMEFDRADVEQARENETLTDIVLHEMGHVLGFGGLWNFQGGDGEGAYQLRTGTDGVDPRFHGPYAIRQYHAIGGSDPAVPVEGLPSGRGTRNAHWRESVFGTELMTGFLGPGGNPMSVVTIASLGDMFYAVDLEAADAYTLAGGAAVSLGTSRIELGDHVLDDVPIYGIEPDGTVRLLLPAPRGARSAPERP